MPQTTEQWALFLLAAGAAYWGASHYLFTGKAA